MSDSSPVLLLFVFQAFLVIQPERCLGEVILTVSPYPARIYQGAPVDTPVLKVHAYDNFTGAPVTEFVLDNGSDSAVFQIEPSGLIKTKKAINAPMGYVFKFFIAGVLNNQHDYKHVEIVVSVKNQHSPRFLLTDYSFLLYRYGVGDEVVKLEVEDDDEEDYNRGVTVDVDQDQIASRYVRIDPDRTLRLIRAVPDHVTSLDVTVIASDGGSPQLTSSIKLDIEIVRIKQPTSFCLSSTLETVTLCWKNPMPLQPFSGYDLTVSGTTNSTVFLPAIKGHTEACYTEKATGFGFRYTFKVTIPTTEASYGSDLENIVFVKTKTGHSKPCVTEGFSVCSYKNPCNDHGKCTTTTATNFTCLCDIGWQGRNCEIQDICANAPCFNDGDCQFTGHKEYKCHCPEDYYGNDCEFLDPCLEAPCQNDGNCQRLDNGTYRCDCLPEYSGVKCQTQDPCAALPCVANRGECLRVTGVDFKCDCLEGYYGERCENEDACLLESEPCGSQGTCQSAGDSFTCLCPPWATGRRCEHFDSCYIIPCLHNGTCTNKDNPATYMCLCLPGFNGNECQYRDICYGVDCNNGSCYIDSAQNASCQCALGFYGDNCDKFDVCLTSPCNNYGTCESSGSSPDHQESFTCSCFDGRSGVDCSIINKCGLDVCKNGGTCQNTPNQGFSCICPEGYYLQDCSAFNPCSSHKCQHESVCQNVSQEDYVCQCRDGWLGDFCEYESPCSANKNRCQNGGLCNILGLKTMTTLPVHIPVATVSTESYFSTCTCRDGFFGESCQFIDPCILSPCMYGECHSNNGSGTDNFTCACYQTFTGRLCDINLDACQKINCLNGGRCADGVCLCPATFIGPFCEQEHADHGESGEGTVDEAMKNLKGLLDVTSDPASLSVEQVMNFTEQLVGLYNHTLRDPRYAWTAFCVLGNLVKVNTSVSEEVEGIGNVNTRLLEFLDNYTSEVRIDDPSGQINISAPELHVKVSSLQSLGNAAISFKPYTTENGTSAEINLEIRIPTEILSELSSATRETRIQFIGYKRSQLFVPANGFPDGEPALHSQPVISATVKGREMKNLTVPVEIRLLNITRNKNYTCVFWDSEGSRWSTEGVTMHSYGPNSVTCTSTHLTSFAVLLDVNSVRTVSEEHERILTYLTYIGCAISTSCLVITIVTYAMFKCLNNEKSGKILLQLCTALLMLNVMFLVGTVDVSGFSQDGCLTVGMFLHFFLLASLMWMLAEAVEMYQALVTVFSKYERLYLLKRCLLAWGIPVIIVAITAAVDSQSYYDEQENRQFCFLTSKNRAAYYASLVGPSCLILLVNTFVFIMVARVILKPNLQQQLTKNTTSVRPAQIRGAFTVMFLLGITWVFGPLAINEAQTAFSYLFCICNSLQGFLIFVFRCLFNPEAKMAWIQLFRTGTLKRKRGPIKSVYTDSTSKGGDARRPSASNTSGFIGSGTSRSSLNKTGNGSHPHPHQLHTTNGWYPNLNGLRRGDKAQSGSKTSFGSIDCPTGEKQISSEHLNPSRGSSVQDEAEDRQ